SIASIPSRTKQLEIAAGSDARQTGSFRSGLSNFLLQALTHVAHALVLVRVRRTQRSHFSGNLANFLPVDSVQRNARLLRIDRGIHTSRQRILDRMRVSQV